MNLSIPATRRCPFAEPVEYSGLRNDAPVSRITLPTGESAWGVFKYEHASLVLRDPRFSSDRTAPGFPSLSPQEREIAAAGFQAIITMDPPEHTEARRAIIGEFSQKRIRTMAPRIQEIVDEAIDDLLNGHKPGDLVEKVSLAVPSLVISELLGLPYEDHEIFQSVTARLLSQNLSDKERLGAVQDLLGYLTKLVEAKERNPKNDLIGRQIEKRRAAGNYDRSNLAALALILLIAGHETTANTISLGMAAILDNLEIRNTLRNDPSRIPNAVEEFMRCFSILDLGLARVAKQDVKVGDVLIRAGEGVMAFSNSANHDPEIFERSEVLDIDRDAKGHLAFGLGAHQCLGQNLARLELRLVFETIIRRIPTLRLAVPLDGLPFKNDSNIYGLYELPVSW